MSSEITVSFKCSSMIAQELMAAHAILEGYISGNVWVEHIKYCAVLEKHLFFLPSMLADADEKKSDVPEFFRSISKIVKDELERRAKEKPDNEPEAYKRKIPLTPGSLN